MRGRLTLAVVVIAVALAGSFAFAGSARAAGCDATAEDVFTPSSGDSGDWATVADWSGPSSELTDGVPNTTATVCWASGVTVTVSGPEEAEEIDAQGSLEVLQQDYPTTTGTLYLDTSNAGSPVTTSTTASSTLGGDLTVQGILYVGGEGLDVGGDVHTIGARSQYQGYIFGSVSGQSTPPTVDVAGNFEMSGGAVGGDNSGTEYQIVIDQTSASGTLTIDDTGTSNNAGNDIYEGSTVETGTTGAVTFDTDNSTGGGNLTSLNTPISFPITTTTADNCGGPGGTFYATNVVFTAPGFNFAGTTYFCFQYPSMIQTGGTTDIPTSDTVFMSSGGGQDPYTLETGATLQVDGTMSYGTTDITGGTLDGTGTIDSTVDVTGGTVAPGDPGVNSGIGNLTVDGTYDQSSGSLAIVDDGPENASLLTVDENATVAGTLAMFPSAGYASSAAPGQQTEVLTAASAPAGTLSSVTADPALREGEAFSAQYTNDQIDALVGTAHAPANTVAPTVAGTAIQGEPVSVTSDGTWSYAPTSYSQQWYDCTTAADAADPASDCSPIDNATGSSYALTSSDVGQYVTAVVTASNGLPGSAPAASPVIGPVAALSVKSAPAVSGTAQQGDQLASTTGTWNDTGVTNTYTYQWQDCATATASACTNIPGATGSAYTLTSSDVGDYVIVAVTAHTASGTSGSATGTPVEGPVVATHQPPPSPPVTSTSPSAPPVTSTSPSAPPVNSGLPSVSGSGAAGTVLTCSHGTWSQNPTRFAYQWSLDGTAIVGATAGTFAIPAADEGATLTCTVTASNAGGTSTPATSKGVAVPVPVVPHCPRATGSLTGVQLGRVRLGMTRAQVDRAYTKSSSRGNAYQQFFCLTPNGVRVGLASPKLIRALPARERRGLAGRVIWASTSNVHYAIHGIRPGATLAAARLALPGGNDFRIGANDWYLAANGDDTAVLKLRHGVVQEIGIAVKALTKGLRAQRIFIASF